MMELTDIIINTAEKIIVMMGNETDLEIYGFIFKKDDLLKIITDITNIRENKPNSNLILG